MLLNLSNHPSKTWSEVQQKTAEHYYGEIVDLGFPKINPDWSAEEVRELAEKKAREIRAQNPTAVHIMGEQTFCFHLVNKLKSSGIPCVASTTERKVTEDKNGNKISSFAFISFREY